jgi:hypothetical protein
MSKNMGTVDRLVRTVAAVVIAILLFTGTISGLWGTILGIVAAAFLVTSALGFCPLYVVLKLSTKKQ